MCMVSSPNQHFFPITAFMRNALVLKSNGIVYNNWIMGKMGSFPGYEGKPKISSAVTSVAREMRSTFCS
jgi:hypothetical protein